MEFDTKRIRWWMLKQRIKIWLANRVIEISNEVENLTRPELTDFLPIHMKTAAIRILQILPDKIQIEHMDLQKSYWLERGEVFKLDWMIEGIE